MRKSQIKTANLVKIGLLSAVAFVLMLFDFIVPIFPHFLKMDFSDVPALVAGFAMGPVAGVFVSLIKNLLYFFTKSSTGGVGPAANFITAVSLVVPAAIIYHRYRTRISALVGVLVGTVVMATVMAFANFYIFIPLYEVVLGFPMEDIIAWSSQANSSITDLRTLVILGITPFNIMKGVVVSIITFILYKHISRLFKAF